MNLYMQGKLVTKFMSASNPRGSSLEIHGEEGEMDRARGGLSDRGASPQLPSSSLRSVRHRKRLGVRLRVRPLRGRYRVRQFRRRGSWYLLGLWSPRHWSHRKWRQFPLSADQGLFLSFWLEGGIRWSGSGSTSGICCSFCSPIKFFGYFNKLISAARESLNLSFSCWKFVNRTQ